jgi:hypothetical protein
LGEPGDIPTEFKSVSFDDTGVGLKDNGRCCVRFKRQYSELPDLSRREAGTVPVDIEKVSRL